MVVHFTKIKMCIVAQGREKDELHFIKLEPILKKQLTGEE